MTRRSDAMSRGYSWEPGYLGWISPEEQMEADAEEAAAEQNDNGTEPKECP